MTVTVSILFDPAKLKCIVLHETAISHKDQHKEVQPFDQKF